MNAPAFGSTAWPSAAARAPALYAVLGVPDTLDGRFDMVGLHAFLLIDRLRRDPPPGPELAQAVFDAMFSDMDVTLREMGVGDLTSASGCARCGRPSTAAPPPMRPLWPMPTMTRCRPPLARNVWRG